MGDDVYISRKGPLEQASGQVYVGQVTAVTPTNIHVTFDAKEEFSGLWRWDVDPLLV